MAYAIYFCLLSNLIFISLSRALFVADGSPSSTSTSTQGSAQGGRESEEPIGGFQYGETEECRHSREDHFAHR